MVLLALGASSSRGRLHDSRVKPIVLYIVRYSIVSYSLVEFSIV